MGLIPGGAYRNRNHVAQLLEAGNTDEMYVDLLSDPQTSGGLLAAVPEEEKDSPFADGMTKIYKQMMTVFEEMGVKAIDAVGEEFNPDYHNAVMHVEDEEAGENIVVEEFQKGYTYKDFVVRHSMVKVAN